MTRKYIVRSKEEKLAILKQILGGASMRIWESRRFKNTLRKHFRYWEHDDLRTTIEQAIYYFNNERPVHKLNRKLPVLFRTELVA